MFNSNQIVKYEAGGQNIELSPDVIKAYLINGNSEVTEQEIYMFMKLCEYQRINPFLREAYLIKYGKNPTQIVCGKELFTKRAEKHTDFDGYEAGVLVLTKDNSVQNRKGTTFLPMFGEQLLGGWAKVYRKSLKVGFETTVMFEEYKGSSPLWSRKPATMIRKVALVQALREAFPDMYDGLYSQEEINTVDERDLPKTEVVIRGDNQPEHTSEKIQDSITVEQCKRLFAIAGKGNESIVRDVLSKYGYESSKRVKKSEYEVICEDIKEMVEEPEPSERSCSMFVKKEDGSVINAMTGEAVPDKVRDVIAESFNELIENDESAEPNNVPT